MEDTTPQIVEAPLTEAERLNVSFPVEGQEVKNVLGTPTGEVVVYDKDENGEVVGWHKEAIN